MRASIRLGRIAGIPIGLHYSWLIIATLISLSLAAHFRDTNPDWGSTVVWSSAVFTALLFFATLVAHELSHALVATAHGLPVRSITLFALGGIAQIEKDAPSAKTEFLVGIVGPITSLVIGSLCIVGALALGWSVEGRAPGPMAAILGWLGSINVVLAMFNLIPGYPLDGGRVLRAMLWSMSGNADLATRQAATVGQFVAGVFIIVGLLRFFAGATAGGLWLAFIGWFLLDAAKTSQMQVTVMASLRGIQTDEVMSRDCDTIDGSTPLDAFVDLLLHTGRRCFIVTAADGEVAGLITPHEVGRIDRGRWAGLRVLDAMRPLQELKTVTPTTPVADALAIMSGGDVSQLPVVTGGKLVGVIGRSHILQLVQTRAELKL